MKKLDRYIGISLARGYLVVLLALVTVFGVLALVEQVDDLDKGNYQAADAFLYVLLTMPGRMLDLAPITALLGGIVGLGMLARGSELIAMQASGVSTAQLVRSVMKTGLILMLTIATLSEFFVPTVIQFAEKRRLLAVSKTGDLLTGQGFWSRDGNHYLNVRSLMHGRIPVDIDIYEFDELGQLHTYRHADRADVQNNQQWKLIDVIHKELKDGRISSQWRPEMIWTPFLAVTHSRVLDVQAPTLSPSNLYQYVQHLRLAGQNTDRFEQVLWRKLVLPLNTGAMVLLSLPFVFGGSPRSTSFSLRLVLGITTGLTFFILDQIIANLGLVLGLSAPIIALIPVVAALTLAGLLFYRPQ